MRVRKGERAIAAAAAMAAVGVLGMVTQRAQAANDVWTGTASNLFNASNWTGNNPPQSGDSLEFGVANVTSGLALSDNLMTPGFVVSGITFDATAQPNSFVISPAIAGANSFTLSGGITDNNINSIETLNDPFVLSATESLAVSGASGSLVLGGVISDAGNTLGLNVSGLGSVTLGGANTYTGNINVNSGVLIANLAETALTNPATSALGNVQVARNIIVNGTGTLRFASSDTMGGNASTTIGSTLVINAGGVVTNAGGQFNTLGAVTLNGGTLTGTGGALDGNTIASMYYLRQSVTVPTGGGVASTISGSGTNDGYSLLSAAGGTTTFNVGVTGAAGADLTVSAPLVNTPTNTGGSFTKTGLGTMLVSGANTFTGTVTVNQGTLNYSGSLAAGNQVTVGNAANNAVMNILPGSTMALTNTAVTAGIGWAMGVGAFSGGTGAVYQSGGTVQLPATSGANLQLGAITGGYGYYNLSGATSVVSMNELDVGGTNNGASANGVLDITGGTLNTSAWITVARGGGTEVGVINMTGGTLNFTGGAGANSIAMGWGGTSTSIINVSNSSLLMTGNFPVNLNFTAVTTNGTLGEVNLNSGGVLRAGFITAAAIPNAVGTGTFVNFNGGTLEPSIANTGFITSGNITGVEVYSGGGTINNLGLGITISRPFLAPGGSGISDTPAAVSVVGGSGYIAPPAVTFSSNTGTGAAGYATINAAGQVTSIVITNRGTNYSDATVNLTGGGGTGASATVSSFTTNVSGGMTFTGSGVTSLTNTTALPSTYTGTTQITGGTLLLSGAGNINSSSLININGTGAKFEQTSSTAVSAPVMVTNGTLDGTTTYNNVTVGNSLSAIITTGNGVANAGATQLTIGSLTFNGAGTLNLKTSAAGMGVGVAPGLLTTATNGLTTSAGTKATINVSNPVIEWTNGTYDLIGYQGSVGGAGFTTGIVSPAVGGRLVGAVTASGGEVAFTVSGFYDIWTGLAGGNWTTAAGNQNWERSDTLPTATPTDFAANDVVLFDDTPSTVSGTTAVNIADTGGVNTSNVTFNNSISNYTLTNTAPGNAGIASGSLIKSGTATVTISTANSYLGGTTLNAGQLNINTNTAISTGAFTINGGVIDNTNTGVTVTLPNNPMTWAGDFTFNGSNPMNMGIGAVTLGATRNLTVLGTGALTVAGTISDGGAGFGLTKLGVGALTLSGTQNYTGRLSVNQGTVNFGNTYNPAALAGTGAMTVGGAAATALTGSPNALLTTSGTINTGAAIVVASGTGAVSSIVMNGGTITTLGPLATSQEDIDVGTGTNAYGGFSLLGGSVNISGFLVAGLTTSSNSVGIWNISGGPVTINNAFAGTIGASTGTTGVVNVTGSGSYSATNTAAGAGLYVGENGTGTLNVSGGGILNLGGAAGSAGLSIGRTAAASVGTVNLGAIDPAGGTSGGGGVINTVRVTRGSGTATFNFHGGTLKALPAAAGTFMTGLTNAYIWNEGGTIDNNGVNITVGQSLLAPVAGTGVTSVSVSGGTGYINTPLVTFTGGTPVTGGAQASAVANINYATGAITGITITNPGNYSVLPTGLSFTGGGGTAPTFSSLTSAADAGGALILNGTGTTTLSGTSTYPGGTTLNAGTLLINSASAIGTGQFTLAAGALNGGGVTLTTNNPQTWNTDLNFIGTNSLNMGTGTVTINATRTVTVTASTFSVGGINQSVSGLGLIKAGAGTFGINGASNYTGSTAINAGTLILGGTGAINNTSSITVNGTGAKLVENSSTPDLVSVTLTNGTVDGTGTLSTVNVADAASNVINHGGGLGQGALTVGNLNFAGAATLNFSTAAAIEGSARLVVTANNGLVSNLDGSAGKDLINLSTTDSSFANGTYDLIQYSGTIGGAGFAGFKPEATIPGVGARQSAVLTNIPPVGVTPGEIALVVSGVFPIWTGQATATPNWTTTPIGSPFNWKLSGGGTTEFVSGDTVQFDDSATTFAPTIVDNTVTPTSTTFINTVAHSYTLGATGNFGILTGSLIKSGNGTVTITNANTYSGNTTISAGTLNINNAAAIGTGNLTITGGAIDSSLGGGVVMTTNNPQNWNGDFSFGGSNPLTMGTGAITLGGNRIITVNGSSASALTENGAIGDTGAGRGITQMGTGTLILNGASTFTGGYTISGGGFAIAGNNAALGAATSPLTITTSSTVETNGHALSVGGLTGDSTAIISNTNATAGSIIVRPTGSSAFAGVLSDGGLGGILSFTMAGTGTETLSNTNTYTGSTTVAGGDLNITGTIVASAAANTAQSITVGNTAGVPAVMTIAGGNVTTNTPASQFTSSIVIGSVAGAIGDVQLQSGTFTNNEQLGIGFGAGAYAAYTQTGGTATSGSYIVVGFNNDLAVYNQSTGSMTVNTNVMTIAAGGTGATAVANFTGNASFTSINPASGGLYVGENGTGTMNVSGTSVITLADQGLILGRTGAASSGMVNLLGGTINTNTVTRGAGTGFFNFNGGTVQANTANANLMTGMSGAFVYQGGATIDTNGLNVSLSQPLLAPSGSGVQSVTFAAGGNGTGYKDIPLVSFTGGTLAAGGAPASGVAVLNYSTGVVSGIQITNPGNYTIPPTGISFVGGGGAAPTVTGVNSTANIGGGLTKVGGGILALTGTTPHTYTGPTLVNQGTLRVVNAAQPVANYNFNTDPITGSFLENSAPNSAGVLDSTLNGTDSETTAASVPVAGTAGPNGKLPPNPSTTNALSLDGFQGQNAAVTISNPITDLSSAASWSVSLWVQTTVVGATLFGKDTNSTWNTGNSAFYLADQNDTVTNGGTSSVTVSGTSEPTAVRNTGGWVSGDTSKPVADGNWHYVTYTDNGTTKAIYLDGTLESLSQNGFTTADVANEQVELGFTPDTAAFPNDGAVNMKGLMTDIQFYNVGLSAAQVTQLFTTNTLSSATGLGLLPATTPVTIAGGAVLDLSFGQTIGSLTSTASSASAIVESGVLNTGNDNTNTTFAGVVSGSGGLGKLGSGTFTLTGVNIYSGDTTVTGGKLVVSATGLLPSTTNLTANNGTASFAANPGTGILAIGLRSVTATGASGLVTLGNAAATAGPNVNSNRTVLVLGSNSTSTAGAMVTSGTGGKVDLGSNDAIVSGGGTAGAAAIANEAQVYSELGAGRGANGLWTSAGITSSSVAAKPSLMALGMEFNDTHSIGSASVGAPSGTAITTTFDGQTVADGDVFVKYTYVGDADLSGRVTASDYVLIDNAFNFNKTAVGTKVSGWINGDFNYDGLINGDDYTLIDNAFNTQGTTVSFAGISAGPSEMIATNTDQIAGSSSSAVPEPTTMGLLGIGAAGLMSRRRRKARTQ